MEPQAIPAEAQQVIDALPPVAAVVLAALAVVGLILWLMGRSLAKPACAVCGLVLGGLTGYVLGEALASEGAMTLPLVLGGAIAGALLAALLFRVWMGATTAVTLALAVPAAVIIWQGTAISVHVTRQETPDAQRTKVEAEAPPPAPDVAEGETPALPPMNIEIEIPQWPSADEADAEAEKRKSKPRPRGKQVEAAEEEVQPAGPLAAVGRVAAGVYERQAAAIRAWWGQLTSPARWLLGVAALAGAGVGLVLGLAAPNGAASLQTALVGSTLLFFPVRELAEIYAPGLGGILPTTPRATLVSLGLITLLGVLVQWALFRRRADR